MFRINILSLSSGLNSWREYVSCMLGYVRAGPHGVTTHKIDTDICTLKGTDGGCLSTGCLGERLDKRDEVTGGWKNCALMISIVVLFTGCD
jgi:hypothetical protein